MRVGDSGTHAAGGDGTEMKRLTWGVFDLASMAAAALGDEARVPCALDGVSEDALIAAVPGGVVEAVLPMAEPGPMKVAFPGLETRGEKRLMAMNCGGTTGACWECGSELLVRLSGDGTTTLLML